MRVFTAAGLAASIFLLAPVHALASCKAGTGVNMQGVNGAPFQVTIAGTESIPLSAPFTAEVTVCARADGLPARVTVDATMPAHKHGMNYVPVVSSTGGGRYQVKGLLFHMPGVWRFEVAAYRDGKPHLFFHEVHVQ